MAQTTPDRAKSRNAGAFSRVTTWESSAARVPANDFPIFGNFPKVASYLLLFYYYFNYYTFSSLLIAAYTKLATFQGAAPIQHQSLAVGERKNNSSDPIQALIVKTVIAEAQQKRIAERAAESDCLGT